jgi:hypothetical protein
MIAKPSIRTHNQATRLHVCIVLSPIYILAMI